MSVCGRNGSRKSERILASLVAEKLKRIGQTDSTVVVFDAVGSHNYFALSIRSEGLLPITSQN